jgi:tetratricopeptide (TPR) repeat protein
MGFFACGLASAALALTPALARQEAEQAVAALISYENAAADTHFHDGDFAGAITVLERVILLNPTDIEPYANAGWLAWSLKQEERARGLYQRMLDANPDDTEGIFQCAVFAMRIGEDANALRLLESAMAHGLTSPKRHLYGHLLLRANRTADALAFWRRVLQEEPTNAVAQREVERLGKPAPAK